MTHTKISSSKAKGRKSVRVVDAATPTKKHGSAAKRAARLMAARLKLKQHHDAGKPGIRIAVSDPGVAETRQLRFGRVVVANVAPDPATVWRNVDAGRLALKRATEVLSKPGVTLPLAPDIPRFRADATQPGMLVRELNGIVQRGRIVDGSFLPAD